MRHRQPKQNHKYKLKIVIEEIGSHNKVRKLRKLHEVDIVVITNNLQQYLKRKVIHLFKEYVPDHNKLLYKSGLNLHRYNDSPGFNQSFNFDNKRIWINCTITEVDNVVICKSE